MHTLLDAFDGIFYIPLFEFTQNTVYEYSFKQ